MTDRPGEEIMPLIETSVRRWNGFWTWRDKPVGECGAAREILGAAGYVVEQLVSREPVKTPRIAKQLWTTFFRASK